jgi:hypothetical protein
MIKYIIVLTVIKHIKVIWDFENIIKNIITMYKIIIINFYQLMINFYQLKNINVNIVINHMIYYNLDGNMNKNVK